MSVYPQAKGIENREAWRDRASLPTRIFKRGHAAGNGVAVDVSRGGLSLETTTPLAPGTICQLCVEVEPGHEFSVYARVTRSENDRVGFAFDPGDPRTIDALFDAWTLSTRGPFVEEEAWPADDEASAA